MLRELNFDLVPQSDFNIDAADEPYSTFVENALAKARHAARESGLPALADDSGLCVDALSGAPGVLSARFAGEPRSDSRNNEALVRRLSGTDDRRAHYTCALAALRTPDDPEPLVVDARWHGEILQVPRGHNGFGYDPLFFIPELRMTAAELDPAHKNRISHRGLALAALATKLVDWDAKIVR